MELEPSAFERVSFALAVSFSIYGPVVAVDQSWFEHIPTLVIVGHVDFVDGQRLPIVLGNTQSVPQRVPGILQSSKRTTAVDCCFVKYAEWPGSGSVAPVSGPPKSRVLPRSRAFASYD